MFQITFWPSNGKVVFMFDNDFEIYKLPQLKAELTDDIQRFPVNGCN